MLKIYVQNTNIILHYNIIAINYFDGFYDTVFNYKVV